MKMGLEMTLNCEELHKIALSKYLQNFKKNTTSNAKKYEISYENLLKILKETASH